MATKLRCILPPVLVGGKISVSPGVMTNKGLPNIRTKPGRPGENKAGRATVQGGHQGRPAEGFPWKFCLVH